MKKLLILLVVLILIVVILFVTGFDLGRFILRDDTSNIHSGDHIFDDLPEDSMTIIVRNDKVYFNKELVEDISTLKSKIYATYYKDHTFIVRDDKAVKETYDEVIRILNELSVDYIEK